MPHLWQITAVREAAAIAFVSVLLFVAYHLSTVFSPIVLALLAAYLIHPVVKFIERRTGLSPRLIVALLLIFICAAVAVVGFWFGPILVHQITLLLEALARIPVRSHATS